MDRSQIRLKLTLDRLGIPLKLDSFDDRLSLQKRIYLLQVSGLHLGYSYNWYMRGPYSPQLARDAFPLDAAIKTGDDEASRWSLNKTTTKRLDSISAIAKHPPEKLEYLASIHYLVKRRQIPKDDVQAIIKILQSYEKPSEELAVRQAIQTLEEHELL